MRCRLSVLRPNFLPSTGILKHFGRSYEPQRMHVGAVQIPVYVHAKEVVDPRTRRRTALEINYMKFLAYNGSYKLFGFIPAGDLVRACPPRL